METKQRVYDQNKWKLDRANLMAQDAELKKVSGLDAFKIKLDKFQMDFTQIKAAQESKQLYYFKKVQASHLRSRQ